MHGLLSCVQRSKTSWQKLYKMFACDTRSISNFERSPKPSGMDVDRSGLGAKGSSAIGIDRAALHVPHGGAMKTAIVLSCLIQSSTKD